MGDAGFFKVRYLESLMTLAIGTSDLLMPLMLQGTSAEQDTRFSNKHKKLLKSMKFPPEFDKKLYIVVRRCRDSDSKIIAFPNLPLPRNQIDFSKVNLAVIKPWLSTEITKILGFEDDVLVDYTFGLLETQNPDPKEMQISLTGFFESKTQELILKLWKLLLSAQESVGGIPAEFLEAKKEQLRQQQLKDEENKKQQKDVMDNIRKRRQAEDEDRVPAPREPRGRGRDDDKYDQRSNQRRDYDRRDRSKSRDRSYRGDRYRGDRYDRRRDNSEDRYRSSRRRSRTPERSRRSRYSRSPSRDRSPYRRPRSAREQDAPAGYDESAKEDDLRAKAMASMHGRED
ncbi:hypothetical protein INT43_006458 [Umbelopsis isabellina]|uniref:PWI domain-containing protein n=1 Tax=Mortierella isabellina TaxID=91625 RepID=A0A8H7Q018_MORIS|nr:hypothetical protein INT43_006458 [Umbelopsis isabellina]